jgi:hypothetical protein
MSISIANKIKKTLIFCSYCCSNTHKLIDCQCKEFLNFKNACHDLKEILNLDLDNFKKWLLVYYEENSKLLYYFALAKCLLPSRINANNYVIINETIENYFYKIDNTPLGDYVSFNTTNITNPILPIPTQVLNVEYECDICFENKIKKHNMMVLKCTHIFCKECLVNCLKSNNIQHVCFICRGELKPINLIV